MRVCTKCCARLLENEFYSTCDRKSGFRSACKKCTGEVNSKWRKDNLKYHRYLIAEWQKKNPERLAETNRKNMRVQRKRYPERAAARWAVLDAIQKGNVKRLPWCQCCGKDAGPIRTEAHHGSYEKKYWLDVAWLCRKHHRELHAWLS
jgi:hypothetical protein